MAIDFTTTNATASTDGGSTRVRRWSVVTAPASFPVTWEEAKAHLNLDTDDKETYVESLIEAATDYAEEALASSLISRVLRCTFYDGEPLMLPRGPVISISAVTDENDNALEWESKAIGRGLEVIPQTSGGFPITVQYTAGYASAAAIPASIRLAILQHVATLYRDRESVSSQTKTPVPHTLEAFYRKHGRSKGLA